MKLLFTLAIALGSAWSVAAEDRPAPLREAVRRMTLPDGFHATLFAGEPDVVQPIAMTFDDRGRLWVVECLSYPKWLDKPVGGDRVLLFEDTDGDGVFDKRQVIIDNGANLTGIELGFGGIWLCSIPNLLFVPCDFNADTPRAGKPDVLLDGWSLNCKHNVFNGLIWGPDGWLYGCNGIIDVSLVGKPGTPRAERIPMNCGVWRYHPARRIFEPVAHGTTNPFGLDFDEEGEGFMTNCVIGHLWHVIPGAHYERMYGQDLTPYTYELMKTAADHIHWGGGNWTMSRTNTGANSEAGGGHAHVGCMVYLGDNWPAACHNGVFMLNLHGSRINHDRLKHQGSGYVATHAPDFMLANDPWFRGIAIKYGPDGGVYVSDWTDTGECHNYDRADLTNGRLYKIVYGNPKPWSGDLSKLKDAELVGLQSHPNEWHGRHARRLLQERALAGKLDAATVSLLQRQLRASEKSIQKLHHLWSLAVVQDGVPQCLPELLRDADVAVRRWAVRLTMQSPQFLADDKAVERFNTDFEPTPAPMRLAVASGLQRQRPAQRLPMLLKLVGHSEDSADVNLALMYWYAAAPLAEAAPADAARLARECKIPVVQRFLVRRLAERSTEHAELWALLMQLLREVKDDASRLTVIKGLEDGVVGRRQIETPPGWVDLYQTLRQSASEDVRRGAMKLAILFGDEAARNELKAQLLDAKQHTPNRYYMLQALMAQPRPDLIPVLRELLEDRAMRGVAIRALAAFKNPEIAAMLLAMYPKLSEAEKSDVVQTLASRAPWAHMLLDAIEQKQLPRSDVSVFVARQIQGLKDKSLEEKLAKVWGQIKPASKEKLEQMAKFKKLLTPEVLKAADQAQGRALFVKNCAACHRLYDDGGNIGPALTGAQRNNLDYILENVLDPSAVVAREYRMTKVETADGRTITGIVTVETDRALTLQTPNEQVIVPLNEIESRNQSPLSIMPEGILEKLSLEEVRNLIGYLAGKDQVPLPGK